MNASNQGPDGTLDARFLGAVEAWCARNGATVGAFGTAACRDRGFVASLRDGRRPRLGTVDRALAVMGEPPVTPAFLMEVEAFLAMTGTKRSAPGLKATGNPSFVARPLAADHLQEKPRQRVSVQAGGRDVRRDRAKPWLRGDEVLAVEEQRAKSLPHLFRQCGAFGAGLHEPLDHVVMGVRDEVLELLDKLPRLVSACRPTLTMTLSWPDDFHKISRDNFVTARQMPGTLFTTQCPRFGHALDDTVQQDAIPHVQPVGAAQHAFNARGKIVRRLPHHFVNRNAEVVGQLGDDR